MQRFYLPPGDDQSASLRLTGREAHHAVHVLRVRRGEPVTVLDGAGLVRECQVEQPARDHLALKVLAEHRMAPLPCGITLAQAIPKGKLFESIIQKAAELGVTRIVPLLTQRTISRVEDTEDSEKVAKWRQVAIESIKQCGSAWLPRVEAPMKIEHFVAQSRTAEMALVGSLREDAQHPRTYFQEFERQYNRKPTSISVAIGPEGDFSDEELSALKSTGALPITLGPLVLRTETAAVYCLSIINYEVQFGQRVVNGPSS